MRASGKKVKRFPPHRMAEKGDAKEFERGGMRSQGRKGRKGRRR
jgi:hypothetical protein